MPVIYLRRIWRIARWALLALAVAYIALVIYRIPAVHKEEASQLMVSKIEAQKLTMADADGSNLPSAPAPNEADATLAGIDANDNGIRDDVELAIFAEYPTSSATSTQVREAELQYAKELQLEFTSVNDTATFVAVVRQEGRGFICVPNESETSFVESLVFDTPERTTYREDLYKKYMTSYELYSSDFCDLQV